MKGTINFYTKGPIYNIYTKQVSIFCIDNTSENKLTNEFILYKKSDRYYLLAGYGKSMNGSFEDIVAAIKYNRSGRNISITEEEILFPLSEVLDIKDEDFDKIKDFLNEQ